jgi:acid phosphatase
MFFFAFIAPSFLGALVVSAGGAITSEPPEATIQPSLSAIAAAVQTAPALSPVSNVKGVAFDRFVQVWLENTDYDAAAGDANQKYARASILRASNPKPDIWPHRASA